MIFFTGMPYFLDQIGVPISSATAAFSFYNKSLINNQTVPPDNWAINSFSGILNTGSTGTFFQYSGTGYFNGSTIMKLNAPYTFDNDTILLSYEKLRTGDEILLSSATGNSFSTYSGFCLGVNNANKLYFKYWNNVEGVFSFTASNILANKNLIIINRNNNVLTMGNLNNNTLSFETETFYIKNNVFKQSDQLFLGGIYPNINWANNSSNFSGYVDKFFIFKNIPFFYNQYIVSGILHIYSGKLGYIQNTCYTTGYFIESGFSTSGITGFLTNSSNLNITGITGYITGVTGYSYSGVTGYNNILLGYYSNNCNITSAIYGQTPLSGLITINYSYNFPQTGIISFTGYNQIPLTGQITGSKQVYITGEICTGVFLETGASIFFKDTDYLESLSFSEISLLSEINKQNDIVEVYYESYQDKNLNYNKNLNFNFIKNNFTTENNLTSGTLVFCNGQLIIDSGYYLETIGYDTFIRTNNDYFITGNEIYVNNLINGNDDLFYDGFTGDFEFLSITGIHSGMQLAGKNFNNKFVFVNGQKLISGITYTGNNTFNLNIPSGNNYVYIKSIPTLNNITGNESTLKIQTKNLNKTSSQVYLNGIKQKLNNNYVENSNFDLFSGDFYENKNNYIIYNNTEDFFV